MRGDETSWMCRGSTFLFRPWSMAHLCDESKRDFLWRLWYNASDWLDRFGVVSSSCSSPRRGVRQFLGESGDFVLEGIVDSHGCRMFFVTEVGESNDTERYRGCGGEPKSMECRNESLRGNNDRFGFNPATWASPPNCFGKVGSDDGVILRRWCGAFISTSLEFSSSFKAVGQCVISLCAIPAIDSSNVAWSHNSCSARRPRPFDHSDSHFSVQWWWSPKQIADGGRHGGVAWKSRRRQSSCGKDFLTTFPFLDMRRLPYICIGSSVVGTFGKLSRVGTLIFFWLTAFDGCNVLVSTVNTLSSWSPQSAGASYLLTFLIAQRRTECEYRILLRHHSLEFSSELLLHSSFQYTAKVTGNHLSGMSTLWWIVV